MAGLNVLLEEVEESPDKKTQIFNKVCIFSPTPLLAVAGTPITSAPSLMNCYLCRKKPLERADIFMYRSKAFCTEECRSRQITADEEGSKKHCFSSAVAEEGVPPRRGVSGCPESQAIAGGFRSVMVIRP